MGLPLSGSFHFVCVLGWPQALHLQPWLREWCESQCGCHGIKLHTEISDERYLDVSLANKVISLKINLKTWRIWCFYLLAWIWIAVLIRDQELLGLGVTLETVVECCCENGVQFCVVEHVFGLIRLSAPRPTFAFLDKGKECTLSRKALVKNVPGYLVYYVISRAEVKSMNEYILWIFRH